MRPAKHRQHRLHLCALFFAAVQTLMAENAGGTSVVQEVQAARAQTIALAVRSASAEEWVKLGRTFADLAARYPREPSVRSGYAEFLWERDNRDQAIREWEEAERLAPKDAAVLARLADAQLAVGHGKKSAQYFLKACAAAPTDARLRHAAGTAIFLFRHELIDARTTEEQVLATALAHLAAATRYAPHEVEYARAYAETFYGLPKPDWRAALAAWEHYLAVSPNRDFAHANLCRVYLKLGQPDAARKELEEIHSSDFERLKGKLREQIEAADSTRPAQ